MFYENSLNVEKAAKESQKSNKFSTVYLGKYNVM